MVTSDQELKQYPRGQIAIAGGDLRQCTNFEWDYSNGGKLVFTLRENPSGIVYGNKQVNFTGETVVSEEGPERDWFDLVDTGKPVRCRVKLPGKTTKSIIGAIVGTKGKLTLEDGVQIGFNGIGKFVKAA